MREDLGIKLIRSEALKAFNNLHKRGPASRDPNSAHAVTQQVICAPALDPPSDLAAKQEFAPWLLGVSLAGTAENFASGLKYSSLIPALAIKSVELQMVKNIGFGYRCRLFTIGYGFEFNFSRWSDSGSGWCLPKNRFGTGQAGSTIFNFDYRPFFLMGSDKR